MQGEGEREGRLLAFAFAFAFAFALVVGCNSPAPSIPVTVPPPLDGGGFGACHSPAAQTLTVDFRADATNDSHGGHGPGVHRLSPTSFLFVWANYTNTLRQDKVSRISGVDVYREPDASAPLEICSRVEIAAPGTVDGARRTYAVAVLFDATRGLPPGPVRWNVDWVAGCPCAAFPEGNATATFDG